MTTKVIKNGTVCTANRARKADVALYVGPSGILA